MSIHLCDKRGKKRYPYSTFSIFNTQVYVDRTQFNKLKFHLLFLIYKNIPKPLKWVCFCLGKKKKCCPLFLWTRYKKLSPLD